MPHGLNYQVGKGDPSVLTGEVPAGPAPGPHCDPMLADPLVVKIVGEDGEEIVPWLGSDIRVRWPLNELPTAQLTASLFAGWGVNTGAAQTPVVASVLDALFDHQRVVIETARQSAEMQFRLFEGFLNTRSVGTAGNDRWANLEFVHIADILRTEPEYVVHGQHWIDVKGIEDLRKGVHGLDEIAPRKIGALDCVLNPDGYGNCRHDALGLAILGEDVRKWTFPVFTFAKDRAQARLWTWARWLLHLLALPRLTEDGKIGDFTRFGFIDLPVADGLTLPKFITDNGWNIEEDAGPQTEPWAQAMLASPHSHSCEGMFWLDALTHTCARCGISYYWEPRIGADGQPRWGLGFTIPGYGRRVSMWLPSPSFETGNKPWQEVMERANVARVDLRQGYDRMANSVGLLGAVAVREITVALVPGWPYAAEGSSIWSWDLDPANQTRIEEVVLEIGMAGMPGDFADHYNTSGKYQCASQGALAGLSLVGRLWGLNTHGAWTNFGRPFVPWRVANYALFDLADVRLGGGANGLERGLSIARPRRFLPCISGFSPVDPFQPLVEISFDAGGSWRRVQGGCQLSPIDMRVLLTADDLRSEVNAAQWEPGGTYGMSLPEAYMRGVLRLRITACIEIDHRFEFEQAALGSQSLSGRVRHTLLHRPGDWITRWRDDVDGVAMGNSIFNRGLYPEGPGGYASQKNSSDAALAEAERFLRQADHVRFAGPVQVPWLVFPTYAGSDDEPLSGYRPGDVVDGIVAEDSPSEFGHDDVLRHYAHDLHLPGSEEGCFAVVDSIEWIYKQNPPACSTTLQLEDAGRLVSFGEGSGR